MELAYRLLLYIFMANVGYMIFSLFQKGFKHYSGYIAQLFFLLCLMVLMVAKEVDGGMAILVSLLGIFLLVLVPIYLQRQIDVLMAENRFNEIEPYARWKANLSWSEMNAHLHQLALLASRYADDGLELVQQIKAMLNRGEPYNAMTRVFLGLLHFNNRNFSGMIEDLRLTEKGFDEQSFEELLYLVRAYLETARFEEAVEAQLALEKKMNFGGGASIEKRANLVISRMIFYAFLGWQSDFIVLMNANEEGIQRLPEALREFWHGVCVFNSGDFAEGEKMMAAVIKASAEDEENEAWLPFMRKRFYGLVENKEFFERKILQHLQRLHAKFSIPLENAIGAEAKIAKEAILSDSATNLLAWLTMIISIALMMSRNIEDVVNLIQMGANSSLLVRSGEYFRLFTYQFIHIGWIHLCMNILALKIFGPPIETVAGRPIFIGIYFLSGIAGGAAAVYTGQPLSAGASAAVLGLLATAIIFEFFAVKGSERLAQKNNFSTLLFILVINLIIGAVEKGVDNSAHLGGLAGGAVLGLLLIPVLASPLFKRLVGFVLVWLCVFIAGGSLWQMMSSGAEERYPMKVASFSKFENASATLSLDLPDSWALDGISLQPGTLEATGPFKERITVLSGFNDEDVEATLLDYVHQRTAEIEKSTDIVLQSRRGPEILDQIRPGAYKIRWLLGTSAGPYSVVDYLIFKNKTFFLLRFTIGTEFDNSYNNLMNRAVSSITFNQEK